MPKGKRRGKGFTTRSKGDTSDEESVLDNASTITAMSDNRSLVDEPLDEEEQSVEEVYEEKMKEAIDGLSLKSAQSRMNALQSVSNGLMKKIIPEFLSDRRMTIADSLERCLKKGRGAEQASAAHLAMLVCFQPSDLADDMNKYLSPLLQVLSRDGSVSCQARSKCCSALALIGFLADGDNTDIIQPMQNLEAIFSGSYLKGNGVVPNVGVEDQALHASALSAWSLLLTLSSPYDVYHAMTNTSYNCHIPHIEKICQLLESSSLEVRMAAGECICLAYEIAREHNEDFEVDCIDELCDSLQELAKDSHKYRAKKDRKTQRASFREILQFVQDHVTPEVEIKFGQEILVLDSWCRKKQYDTICSVLGSGMNFHLAENRFLRQIFGLGDKISLMTGADLKQSKQERHLANAAAFKHRTITRGKNRDKRSVVLSY